MVYKNEINSYTIAEFETDEEATTIVGYLPFINSGDTIKAIGKFVEHKEYGRQFKVDTFEKMMPKTLGAIEKYLANGNIKGIGAATAKKIVKKFGKETIHVFKYEPNRLAEIRGISINKAKEMSEEFIQNWEVWQIVGFLDRFGIGADRAINYECDKEGTALNYQVLSETVSAVRRSKSRVEMDEAVFACCAPIREDYKRRHKSRKA